MNKVLGLVSLVKCECGGLCFSGLACDRKFDVLDGKPIPHKCVAPLPPRAAIDVVNEFLDGCRERGGLA